MDLIVAMPQPEQQPGARQVTGDAHGHAIRGTSTLDLDPVTLTWQVPSVGAFGDDALGIWHQPEPVIRFIYIKSFRFLLSTAARESVWTWRSARAELGKPLRGLPHGPRYRLVRGRGR